MQSTNGHPHEVERNDYTGVILAAGRGLRIDPLSKVMPKPLLPIGNKPVMQYQIEAMAASGIRDLVVVIGHLGQHIPDYFGDGSRLGVRMRYVVDENPQGIASSLALVEPYVRDKFAVFLGDIFLSLKPLDDYLAMMERAASSAVIFVKREEDHEAIKRNFAVLTDKSGRIERVIEKPKEFYSDLKGCGVYIFDKSLFDAIRKTPRSSLRNEYELTDAIQILLEMGTHGWAAEGVEIDFNLTVPGDLLHCNMLWLRRQRLSALMGNNVHIVSGAALDEAILGNDVRVSYPITLRRSVVFPNTEVSRAMLNGGPSVLEHCLIMPNHDMPLSLKVG